MTLETTGGAPENAFAVDFSERVDGLANRDFRGPGVLRIRAEEPRFVFSGRSRGGLFPPKAPVELSFRSDELWNVVARGRGIRFSTRRGKSGAQHGTFVFAVASVAQAEGIAALLPPTQDAEYLAGQSFLAELRALPDSSRGAGSIVNLLIAANLAVFVAMGLLGAGWIEVASMDPYIRYGANNAAATTDGQWWRLVTCLFLHYGLVHLLLNQWALFQAGHLVERLFGRTLFTLVYFGSGIVGSLATLRWHGDAKWSAGASGAVFGVYGALLGYLWREQHGVPKGIFQPMLRSTLLFAGYNLFYGAVHPAIDNAAHLGGLLGGVAIGWTCALPLERAHRERVRARRGRQGLLVAAALVALGIAIAPRYDYRVGDELAWRDTNTPALTEEKSLAARESAALAAFARTQDAGPLLRWLQEDGIPFYETWRQHLAALALAPGRATDRRRRELDHVLVLKLERYRRLDADLRAGKPLALATFRAAEDEIAAAVAGATRPR